MHEGTPPARFFEYHGRMTLMRSEVAPGNESGFWPDTWYVRVQLCRLEHEMSRESLQLCVASNVTPRDLLEVLSLDTYRASLYHEAHVSHEMRPGHSRITLFPGGDPLPLDTAFGSLLSEPVASEVRLYVLGDVDWPQESESSGDDGEAVVALQQFVYVLRCRGGHYYIGKTTNPSLRIVDHQEGDFGAAWTRAHPPEALELLVPASSDFEEQMRTLEYMKLHGIDKVRGGPWTKTVLSTTERSSIEHLLRSASDACYTCHQRGHFQADCPQRDVRSKSATAPIQATARERTRKRTSPPRQQHAQVFCVRCGRGTHHASACYARSDIEGEPLDSGPVCFRCGRDSHLSTSCYAKRDVWGNML